MMKRTMHLIALLFVCFLNAQNSQILFEEGNAQYRKNNFEKAIAIYTEIIDGQNLGSKELYFNLANAYYKTNKIGPSIYYYEKALSLDPTDSDVLNNLSFAQKMTIDRIEVLPVSFGERFRKATILQLHPNIWAIIALIGSFLFVLFFLLYRFSSKLQFRKLSFGLSILSLFLLVIGLTFSISAENYNTANQQGIVFFQEVAVKAAPTDISEEIFQLHEGTKVQITDSVENWLQIKLTDGKVGWLTKEAIQTL